MQARFSMNAFCISPWANGHPKSAAMAIALFYFSSPAPPKNRRKPPNIKAVAMALRLFRALPQKKRREEKQTHSLGATKSNVPEPRRSEADSPGSPGTRSGSAGWRPAMPASLRATRDGRRRATRSEPEEWSVPGPFLGEVTGVWEFFGV